MRYLLYTKIHTYERMYVTLPMQSPKVRHNVRTHPIYSHTKFHLSMASHLRATAPDKLIMQKYTLTNACI